jgi:hypothetical protein
MNAIQQPDDPEIFPKVVDGGGWEKGILRER